MKRGRPSKRSLIMAKILETLSEINFPANVTYIQKKIAKKIGELPSWNTVKKYLEELAMLDKVEKVVLPHSKNKNKQGLTVYKLKK